MTPLSADKYSSWKTILEIEELRVDEKMFAPLLGGEAAKQPSGGFSIYYI